MPTIVYTDGACLGNPGPGGWAWAVARGRYASGAASQSTNQRMEITAVLEAIAALDGAIEIVSDSTYVVNCFRDRWWEGWLARGWVNSARKPVANRDLWEPLIELYRRRQSEITFRWVKGHHTDPTNDLVDRLAVEAARTQQGRTGDGVPADLGTGDGQSHDRDARLPPGRLVVVTGHRPPELGGYGENPLADEVRQRLAEILAAKHELHPDLVVVTGLGLGAEQLAAHAARQAGVPFVAVLPFPEQDDVWPPASQRMYRELLDGASTVVQLQATRPKTKQQAGAAISRRNGWLTKNTDEAVVVWDGSDQLLGKLVRSLEDRLGPEVWIVDPRSLR